MSDFPVSSNMTAQATNVLTQGMELVDLFVNKNYLINVDQCEPIPLPDPEKTFSVMSLFQIDKIVYDENENINDKLVSVYSALCNFGSTALLIIDSDEAGARFYLGTRDTSEPYVAKEILKKSLHGNFPGINMREKDANEIQNLMETRLPCEYSNIAVTSVSIVPSMRDQDKEHFIQGLEKFIDSMAGEKYTAIFISQPLSKEVLEDKKRGYEEMYSALSQCSELRISYGENESESVAVGVSEGFSKAVNNGISDTTGSNRGTNRSHGHSRNHGMSFGILGTGFNFGSGSNSSRGSYSGTSESHTDTHSETDTATSTQTDTLTNTRGRTGSIEITSQNKTVKELMDTIDEQLKRIKKCESYGLWDSACYFTADKQEVAIVAANTYKALVAGENTSVENSFINVWDNTYDNKDKSLDVLEYLRYGIHPKFTYKPEFQNSDYEEQEITVASMISGIELPILMGFPHKSVNGVTSIVSAEFGRNVFRKSPIKPKRGINLGAIYHMGEVFKANRVLLDLDSLTAHCFITGSTGSGKSNTTYKVIDELTRSENDVRFLVIEPAKGEYKLQFGDMPDINIFTSNPNYYSMLRLNPFEFPEEIHVLEHLDRLIEIFSACWPLYAAMPAVLKQSFERAYIIHGWDLNNSTYTDMGNGRYPNFKDVVRILPAVVDESEFSAETRGNYVGSLVTRVQSLTNGIVGQIFNSIGIDDEILFDQNSIVDLSRVGSTETKALIMGVLVLKLSEHRQASAGGTNQKLKHVTIMEEAHNLLKRTLTDQGQESANVQGKSVEMISNSIAEMRTYGEGFIIVDQSPSAVDISAIKNTNTKIVMRLPEANDCESIGRSIGLDDGQIRELSRLDKGVAAVYQNDWLETVLVRIDKASSKYEVYDVEKQDLTNNLWMLGELMDELIYEDESKAINIPELKRIVSKSKVESGYKRTVERMLDDYKTEYDHGNKKKAMPKLIVDLLNCGDLLRIYDSILPAKKITKTSQLTPEIRKKVKEWGDKVRSGLDRYADFADVHTKDVVFLNLIFYMIENSKYGYKYKYALYLIRNKAGKK